ncbi:ENR1 protein, partial [Cisticola juncidis]|nr:ENR1 protein [Cisticola juncidis]
QGKESRSEMYNKNLFINLVEQISRELNVTNCWICGSTQMTDMWPWEGTSLSAVDILRWKQTKPELKIKNQRGNENWELKSKIIGEECIKRIG